MVPRRGLEPPRPFERQNLNLVRLPIPPPGLKANLHKESWPPLFDIIIPATPYAIQDRMTRR